MSLCLYMHLLNHTSIHVSISKNVSVYVLNKCGEEFTTIIIIIIIIIALII